MGSSSSQSSSSTALNTQSKQQRKQILFAKIKNSNEQNFYELFGFENYSSPSASEVSKSFRRLSIHYHPDKNPPELKDECNAIVSVLVTVKETLTDAEKKRRYDLALRRARREESKWDTFDFLCRCAFCAASIAGGSLLILAGILGAVPTGGASIAASVAGGALLSGGINGAISTYKDPDQSIKEFATDVLVGGVQGAACGAIASAAGAACGAISAAAAPASKAATLAVTTGIYAGAGSSCAVTFKGVKDASDLMRGKQTREEILSSANAKSYAWNALIGGCIGGCVGLISVLSNTNIASEISDDASGWLSRLSTKAMKALTNKLQQDGVESPEQIYKAIQQAYDRVNSLRLVSGLNATAVLAGYATERQFDRFTILPTACFQRSSKYMKLACGQHTRIRPAPLEDYAFGKKVLLPLKPEECLRAYTEESPLYRNVNSALCLDDNIKEYAAYIWHTKQAIKQNIKSRGLYPGTVWRSATLEDEHMEFYKVGHQFLWANFVSTSKKKDIAQGFGGNALFKIDCTGPGITYCSDISHLSAFEGEDEVLFFPYSGFVVQDVKRSGGRIVVSLQTCDTLMIEPEHSRSKRKTDRFTCTPKACYARAPNYKKLARGQRTQIQPAPLEDYAGGHQVLLPTKPEECLRAYTEETPLYQNVNSALRFDDNIEECAAYVWHIKQAIKQNINSRGLYPGTVWRSAMLEDEHMKFYKVGRKFLWANFVSTLKKEDSAQAFDGNVLFKIDCTGQGITYCSDISHLSNFEGQDEVLFFPYSGFVVQDVKRSGGRTVVSLATYDTLLVEAEHASFN